MLDQLKGTYSKPDTMMLFANDMLFCSAFNPVIRSAKQDDIYGASNIVLPCPCCLVIFHLVQDVVIILKSSM
jgi:hypothetical protein